MGLFDKFMNAIGFASEEDLERMQFPEKNKHKMQKTATLQNQYDLSQTHEKDIISFSPSSQEEVMNIVEFLKNGASAKIDLAEFSYQDLLRAIDFLEGASFALGITPVFQDDHTVILEQ